jgi:hypothetical protein
VPIEGAVPNTLLRAVRIGGTLVIDDVFVPLGPSVDRLYSATFDFRRGRLAVAACTEGYCGGYGPPSPDAANAVFRSDDGGITWQRIPSLPVGALLTGFLPEGELVASVPSGSDSFELFTWPSRQEVKHPPGTWPALVEGELLWQQPDGHDLLDVNGNVAIPAPRLPDGPPRGPHDLMSGRLRDVVVWVPFPRDSSVTGYASEVDEAGKLGRTVKWEGFDLDVIARVDDDAILLIRFFPPGGGIGATFLADFRNGAFREVVGIKRPADIDAYPLGLLRGSFGRVSTGGDCLFVREGPSMSSRAIGCYRDGTLLTVTGPSRSGDAGGTWLPVLTPGGSPGYASQQFLQR